MEKCQIVWPDNAKEQVQDIFMFLFDGSPSYADNWTNDLERKLNHLANFPEMGRIVPEFGVSFIREIFVGQYRLVSSYQNKIITVVTVRSMQLPLGRI